MAKTYNIVLLPGDGIGPEVTHEAVKVIKAATEPFDINLDFSEGDIGGKAIDRHGSPLPDEVLERCLSAHAVLLGAVGGPKWDHHSGEMRPESGLLKLRKKLGVYANLRPVAVPATLVQSSPLKSSAVEGTDLLVVRELTGGIYFGEPRGRTGEGASEEAFNTMRYAAFEIERVARIAFDWARKRKRTVTSVDKANVLVVSQLWRDVVTRLHRQEFSDVELTHMYVDNAAMQLVLNPRQFDVILTGNLFGDILSDAAATLGGSLGLLPSASIGGSVGLFEPVHGSAPDIAGTGKANPIAAILSGAMMLDYLGESAAAEAVKNGVQGALQTGVRTADLAPPGAPPVSTADLSALVRLCMKRRSKKVVA